MSKLRSQLNNLRSGSENTGLLEPATNFHRTPASPATRPQNTYQTQENELPGSFDRKSLPNSGNQKHRRSILDADHNKRALDTQKTRQELAEVKASLSELTDILIKTQNSKAGFNANEHTNTRQSEPVNFDPKQLAGTLTKSISSSLQKDLRQQLSAEIETMRNELATLQHSATKASDREVLEDIKRISQGIQELQSRQVVTPKQFTDFTGDLRNMHRDIRTISENKPEQINSAEITKSIQDSYNEIARRLDGMGTSQSSAQIDKLNEKLEVIKDSLSGTDPHTLARIEGQLQALGDGISTLASSIEGGLSSTGETSGSISETLPTYFDNLDRRMDEITRAVMASAPSEQISSDEAAFDRIEARINSLAKSIENLAPVQENRAVEDAQFANLMQVPEQLQNTIAVLDRLEERVAHAHIQPNTAENSTSEEFGSLIASLTQKIDQMQLAASSNNQHAHTPTSGFDNEVSAKLDAMALTLERAVNSGDGSIDQLQSQIAELSNRIEVAVNADHQGQQNRSQLDDRIFGEIQTLAARMEQFDSPQSGLETHNEQLEALQNQITAISSQLQSFNATPELGAIENRLGGIESQSTAITALAEELKSLTTSSSELKGHSLETFDAVRDSLAMILDRINSIEIRIAEDDTANTEFSNQTHEENHNASMVNAAREYANSLNCADGFVNDDELSSPTLPVNNHSEERHESFELPQVEPPALDLQHIPETHEATAFTDNLPELADPDYPPEHEMALPSDDFPLEPGSGAPDLTKNGPDMDALMRQAKDNKRKQTLEDEQQNPIDFIAAARRAAQAAAIEAESIDKNASTSLESGNKSFAIASIIANRKKPLMFGAVAVLLAVLAVPAFNYFSTPQTINVVENSADDPTSPNAAMLASDQAEPVTQSENLETAENANDIQTPIIREIPTSSQLASTTQTPKNNTDATTKTNLTSPQASQLEVSQTSQETTNSQDNKQITSAPMPPKEVGPAALRQAAAFGDSKALFEVGRRYTTGINGSPDFAKAAQWYQRAADAGFAPAQYRLGNFYEKGHGLPSDANKAAEWYKLAADQGNALAMHNLAVINAMGVLTNGANMVEASKWFEKAAEYGVKDSQVNLGIVYAKAMGVEANLPEAYKWFAIAAKAGDKDAAQKRDTIAKQMRPDQLELARGKVELWQPKELNEKANNVEIPVSWKTSPQITASLTSKQMITKSQVLLAKLGFKPGPADGLMGAKTVNAIKNFQSRAGIPTNGKVSMELLGALEKSDK